MSTIQTFSLKAKLFTARPELPTPVALPAPSYEALLDRLQLCQASQPQAAPPPVAPQPAVSQAALISPSHGMKQLFQKLDTLLDRWTDLKQPAAKAKAEAKPAPKPAAKPKAEAKPAPKPAAKAKPEAKPTPKPAPKPAVRPDTSGSTFVSQYRSTSNANEDATRANGNCGPASLTIVAEAFGKRSVSAGNANAAIEDTRRRMGAGTSNSSEYSGTSYAQLVQGAKSYGLDSEVLYGGLDKLKAELAKGRLVIAHLRPSYLFPNSTSGHYTVVTKVANGRVYMHDPANASGPMSISEAQFKKSQAQRGAYGLISLGA